MADAKAGTAAFGLVDQSHHRGVGADIDATLGVFLGDEVDWAGLEVGAL